MAFTAKYRGTCSSEQCDRPIEQGDEVVYADLDIYHEACAVDGGILLPIARDVCPDCFIERSVSGACSC